MFLCSVHMPLKLHASRKLAGGMRAGLGTAMGAMKNKLLAVTTTLLLQELASLHCFWEASKGNSSYFISFFEGNQGKILWHYITNCHIAIIIHSVFYSSLSTHLILLLSSYLFDFTIDCFSVKLLNSEKKEKIFVRASDCFYPLFLRYHRLYLPLREDQG